MIKLEEFTHDELELIEKMCSSKIKASYEVLKRIPDSRVARSYEEDVERAMVIKVKIKSFLE